MCGRYVISSSPEAIRATFGYGERPNFPPRYNVAPTQPVPVVRMVEGKRSFALMRWGFVPGWVKDPKTVSLMINARGESVNDKPAFRNAMRRRRCLVPADGFYDWRPGAPQRPYFVRAKSGAPLAFAGLWETWTGPNGEEVDTAAILTTRANRLLSAIHERMPVIVRAGGLRRFGSTAPMSKPTTAAALIAPAPEALLECYEVSPAVNRVANDSAELIAPAPTAPDRNRAIGSQNAGQAEEVGRSSVAVLAAHHPAQRARALRPLDRGLDHRDLVLGERLHPLLALERGGDEGRELFRLARLARRRLGLELRHHFGGEQLERLADVVVAVASGLLQEDHLVDAAFAEARKVLAHVLRRADAGRVGRRRRGSRR